jgi:hypothetical protein
VPSIPVWRKKEAAFVLKETINALKESKLNEKE